MRRKLINMETYELIQKNSLSSAEQELVLSEDILAQALGVDGLALDCFGESSVVYETLDGTYVRADYALQNQHLVFENIEELVIDDESAQRKGKETVAAMIEALLNKEDVLAEELFGNYMNLPSVRKTLFEGREKGGFRGGAEAKKAGLSKSKNAREHEGMFKARKKKLDSVTAPKIKRKKRGELNFGSVKTAADRKAYNKRYQGAEVEGKHRARKILKGKGVGKEVKIVKAMKEWATLSENVLTFVNYHTNAPVLNESAVKRDERGNVVAVRIPSSKMRNEARLLSMGYKTLDSKCKTMRETALGLATDKEFCKAIAVVKRHNNLSDNTALQEGLENLIGRWPNVLYLTQGELAAEIKEALEISGVTNFDDQTCVFLAEGILRTAHGIFTDRVQEIMRLAHSEVSESEDPYLDFQQVIANFYPTLDENFNLESRVFTDLLRAVNEVASLGRHVNDAELEEIAADYIDDLTAIVNGEAEADIDFAEEVAEWLNDFVETNLTMGNWEVSSTAHTTINGDHPAMAEKARKSYSPASDLDPGWGDPAPMIGQDNMSYKSGEAKKARTSSWANINNADTYPSLQNPYIPKPFGDYTMKGEKGADKDWSSSLGMEGGSDTWPTLKNPYSPTPFGTNKMKNGPETDLVSEK